MATYVKSTNPAERATDESSRESFRYAYLPKHAQRLLQEAFKCYAADLNLAFAVMCRRSIAVCEADSTAAGTLGFRRLFDDAIDISRVEDSIREVLYDALFGAGPEPEINADEAAVLIEVIRDMFEQRYVRAAQLRRAIRMRRLFAHDAGQDDGEAPPLSSVS